MSSLLKDLALQAISERAAVDDTTVRYTQKECVDEVHRRSVDDPCIASFLLNVIPELLRLDDACGNEYDLCERYSDILQTEIDPWLTNVVDGSTDTSRLRLIVVPTGDWEAGYREPFLFFSVGFFYVLRYLSTLVSTMAWIESRPADDAFDRQRSPVREDEIDRLRQDVLSKGLLISLRFLDHFCLLPDLDAIMPLIDSGWEEGVRVQQRLVFGAMAAFVCLHEFGHSTFRGADTAGLAPPPSMVHPETLNKEQLEELAADHAAIEFSNGEAYVLLGAGILLSLMADMEPVEPNLRNSDTHPHSINRLSNILAVHRERVARAGLEDVYSQPIIAFQSRANDRIQEISALSASWDDATLSSDFFQSMSDLVSIVQDEEAM